MALYEGKFSNQFKLRSGVIYDDRKISFVRNASGNATAGGLIANRDARQQDDKVASVLQQNEAVFKFTTGEIGHTVLGGFEFEYAKVNTVRNSYGNLPGINLYNPLQTETSFLNYARSTVNSFDRALEALTYSAYAQEQVSITKQFKARAGARLDHVEASDVGVGRNEQGVYVGQRVIAMARDLVSWQAGAVYQPWEPVSFYGGYAEGRYVALNTEAQAMFTISETSSQVEFGNKTSWYKDRLKTNLALFQTTRANYSITDTSGNVSLFGGKRESKGIELDISGNPYAGLWLIFNSALMDSKIKTNEVSSGLNLNGLAPQNIPEYAGSAWATYEFQSGFVKGFGIGGGPTFKSGVYVKG
jgi:iron complex outermembrane receptor protein